MTNENDKLKNEYEKMKEGVLEKMKKTLNPEFLNRVDKIVVFKPLNEPEIEEVVKLNLATLAQRLKDEKEIEIVFSKKAVDWIAKNGFDKEFGARPIRRLIENEVENLIAEEILENKVREGDRIKVDIKGNKVTIEKQKQMAKLLK